MTIPREVSLINTSNGYQLKFKPVNELLKIQGDAENVNGSGKLDSPLALITFDLMENEKEFTLIISNDVDEKVTISLDQQILSVDRTHSGLVDFNEDFPAIHQHALDESNRVNKVAVYLDVSSIEVFINDGEVVFTDIVFPTKPYHHIQLEKTDPQLRISALESIWR